MENHDKKEILDAIHSLSGSTDQRFEAADKKFDSMQSEILGTINDFATNVQGQFNELKTDVAILKTDVTAMKAVMVDKEYLDDKLGDLKGGLIVIARKEDAKLVALATKLEKKEVLTKSDLKEITSMEPFPPLTA